jgi:GH15 family glucan-1,4-alpha-glucosidase
VGRYPPIEDYGLLSDCHSIALVSRDASIDWCFMPRIDSPSCYGRLLDRAQGGHCSIEAAGGDVSLSRRYVGKTMVLRTTFGSRTGEATVTDFFAVREGGRRNPYRQLVRIVDGVRGHLEFDLVVVPRFDYGLISPWLKRLPGAPGWALIGGDNGLLVTSDVQLELADEHRLRAGFAVRTGDRVRLSMTWMEPERLDEDRLEVPSGDDIDQRLEATLTFWSAWAERAHLQGPDEPAAIRSALVIKALSNAPTGAIAAAATTSLPEEPGGARNFDYRYSWIRDSAFSVDSLAEVGCTREADEFRRFIQRSAAGSGSALQVLYGVGGQRSLSERQLDHLDGYASSRPVRVGNAAAGQLQLDAFGELVRLGWQWHRRGHSPSDDYWRFLVDLIDEASRRWKEPDHGIWEIRGRPLHFVHSKVMCWVALDRGIALAEQCLRRAPVERWRKTAKSIRSAVERRGYDRERGVFVQAFDSKALDASLLLLPMVGFVEHSDERMLRTVRAIRDELEHDGFLARYKTSAIDDGFEAGEGCFLACSFWLAADLAHQGQLGQARAVFDRASAASNDLGLFGEEFDPRRRSLRGNFPQALTHLSHIQAAVALAGAIGTVAGGMNSEDQRVEAPDAEALPRSGRGQQASKPRLGGDRGHATPA